MSEQNDIRTMLSRVRNLQPAVKQTRMINESVGGIDNQEFEEEKKQFSQAVGVVTSFGNFQKYDNQVMFQGAIGTGETLKWNFSTTDGLVITTQGFTLDDTNYATIEKLKAYFDIWKDKWIGQMNTGGVPAGDNAAQAAAAGGL